MQTAIATDYRGYSYNPQEISGTLHSIANAGITHVHWSHGWDGDHLFSEDEIHFICQVLRETGLRVKGIHGTNGWYYSGTEGQYKWLPQAEGQISYTSFDEDLRKQGEKLIQNRLELAKAVGTREVVMHMQLPYVFFDDEDYKERYYSQAFKSLDAVQEYAVSNGIRICMENLVGTPNSWQYEEFDRLFDRYSPEFMGFCCDTGHSTLADPENPFDLPRKYRHRMYMIHLNENHSFPFPGDFSDDRLMSQCDEHLVMGEGCVDFNQFAAILADSPYEFPVVGEFNMYREKEEDFLKTCKERLADFAIKVEMIKRSVS